MHYRFFFCLYSLSFHSYYGLFFFFFNIIYLFIFGCAQSSLLCMGFLQLGRVGWSGGATLRRSAQASHCRGFSCCRARAPGEQHLDFVVVRHRGPASAGSRGYPQDERRRRERRHVRPALIGPSLRGREREREREWPDGGVCRVWQSLAMLYFLPWLLYPKLVHF